METYTFHRSRCPGSANRDIAAQLFLSPRTVGYHLYKAFPKLGITARTELAALQLTGTSAVVTRSRSC
ncbi:helix-turn-helix transcriptional regulator [Nocardia sp. NPDC050799]|uniref:helix-turn-helix domain-containing protein n=1 Tax=Nocardia sp. NPDC050799 TaxID=3154842 RepID=UPI0033FC5580